MVAKAVIRYSLFLVLSYVAINSYSFAQQTNNCSANASMAELSDCAQADYKQADARLNSVYKKLRNKLDDTGKKLLRDAQRAWIKYRDAECAWAIDSARGGSMVRILHPQCLETQTAIRADELELYLNDYSDH